MRTQAMSSRMLYNRPLPVNRIVNAIADSELLPSLATRERTLTLLLQRPRSTLSTTDGDLMESVSSSPAAMYVGGCLIA